ncbi:MAG: hypothetical protein ACSLFE_00575 [Gemmatimonadaceae bacterium]
MSERALRAADVPAAAELLACDPCWADNGERPSWVLDTIAESSNGEHAALGSFAGDELRAFVSFNFVAGADRTGAISCVARADEASGIAALSAAVKELSAGGARLIVAELPDLPEMHNYSELLTLGGFAAEAYVNDYYADGIGMRVLVARLATNGESSPA